jgi:hypothetical protein
MRSYPAGVNVIEVERLRSDLLLRPLSRPAVRVARELLDTGCLDNQPNQLVELFEFGLALPGTDEDFANESPDELIDDDESFVPTRLLRHLERYGLLGILDDSRGN